MESRKRRSGNLKRNIILLRRGKIQLVEADNTLVKETEEPSA